MKSRIAVHDLCYLQPLLYGLEKAQSDLELVYDIPSRNSVLFSERSNNLRSAFLSPIDYARHGADYCIVPDISVSSKQPSQTILLLINHNVSDISRIAVDIRFTSEIILAKIILEEKYRNLSSSSVQYLPMMPNVDEMLAKADAALVVQSPPTLVIPDNVFALDLVEEWIDLTDLPYVHGFWVGREEELSEDEAKELLRAKKEGVLLLPQISEALALRYRLPVNSLKSYFSAFSYDFGEEQEQSVEDFFHYAFFHGALQDVPELRFFDLPPENEAEQNIN
ncbi:MAG TPA: hypothetical protein PK595_03160 [Bacteroidota bacterium]|jgi:chorismate dehydratase|nr:hypothetical protein [Bacteroidota bacterium]